MTRSKAKGFSKVSCPSCGERVELRFAKDHFGVCPRCGEWLSQQSRANRQPGLIDSEVPSRDFDESEAWEHALNRKLS